MFLAFAVALLGAAQAEPLDPDLACIVDRVPVAARTAILTEAAGGTAGPVRAALVEATAACAQEHGWSEEYTAGAGRIAAALVLAEEASAALDRAGISVAQIDDWFEAQPVDFQSSMQMDEAVGDQMVDHLVARGATLADVTANAERIGLYIGARMQMERVGAGIQD